LLIYITHPYTAATPALTHVNVVKAIDLGLQVFAKGHTPFIPVLNHYVDLRAAEKGIEITYEDFMGLDFDMLERPTTETTTSSSEPTTSTATITSTEPTYTHM